MGTDRHLITLLRSISAGDRRSALALLDAEPNLAVARVERRDELFIAECHAQVYAGDTALHAAAFAYDGELATELIRLGADVRAANRRGAEPLHAATIGSPGTDHWNPPRQAAIIELLITAGADPNAPAVGGVTPLHRAVRNRCSAAVDALLRAGADPQLTNDGGSTALDLTKWTTGRGGSGSTEARAEQQIIVELLARAGA